MTTQAVELELLRAAAAELSAAAWGTGTAIAEDWAKRLSISKGTLLKRLKTLGFYDSGRKTRADKGKLSISEDVALQAAGRMHLATRANGKRNLHAGAAADVLFANGLGRVDKGTGEIVKPAASTLARAMRQYRCHPDQLAAGHPALSMRSLHPNHVWQIDSSVAVLFYAPDGGIRGLEILDDSEVYKNKPDAIEKVSRDLCIRWMLTCHTSQAYFVRYMAGREDTVGFTDFLIEAMQDRGEPLHGVPKILVMDKGSAGRAATARNLLKRLGIEVYEHKTKNSRAKGSVEGMHDIWEGVFESRLFMWLPDSIAALNAKADMVRRAHCSNAEHSRHKLTRWGAWQRITADQLRLAPSVEQLRDLVTTGEESRKVDAEMCISFAVKGFGSKPYHLANVPGVQPGDTVRVVVNPYRAPAIDVLMQGTDGLDVAYTVMPAERDSNGFFIHGNVWGEEIKALPKTESERQLERIFQAAYGVPTREEAERERKLRFNAYPDTNPFADFEAVQVPTYLRKRGGAADVQAIPRELPPVALPDAVRQAKAAGVADPGLYARWAAEHGAEVPQAVLDAEIAAARTAMPTTNLRASA